MVECFMLFFILLACLINWHVEKRETLLLHQVTHVNDSMTHILNKSCHAWVMSRVSHVTRESCHTHAWVMSRTYVSHVTWLIWTRDMTHQDDSVVVMSHVIHERVSRYTYARVMSHLFINHVTRMNKDDCVTSFFLWSLVWSAAMHARQLSRQASKNVTHSSLFMRVTWLYKQVWHDSRICIPWPTLMYNMTHDDNGII